MHFNLFTTCTSSGTVDSSELLNGKRLEPFQTHSDMADYWSSTVKEMDVKHLQLASSLYTGVSFRAAQKIIATLKQAGHTVDLYIMSIGYGLIDPEEKIFPYNLSLIYDLTNGSASMYRLIGGEKFNPELWWELINGIHGRSRSPIFEVIKKDTSAINLMCTSATFLGMVASDVYKAVHEFNNTVIILGPSNTSQYVKAPKRLLVNGNIIPIDKDKLSLKIPGNKFDQAQRAGIYLINKFLEADPSSNPLLTPNTSVEFLTDILYGSRAKGVGKTSADYANLIEELKTSGKSMTEAHQGLLSNGHMIPAKAFQLMWDPESVKQLEEENDEDAAISSLQNIGLVTPDNEEESTELLFVFRNAIIKGGFTGTLFGANQIHTWAKTYCEKTNKDVPGKFQSPQKLTHFIKHIGPTMNIFPADNPKVQTASFQVIL